jgi:hypothetical protein
MEVASLSWGRSVCDDANGVIIDSNGMKVCTGEKLLERLTDVYVGFERRSAQALNRGRIKVDVEVSLDRKGFEGLRQGLSWQIEGDLG